MTALVPLTRRQIATAAVQIIWECQQQGLEIFSQQDLADLIGVTSGATVGNALTAFGDEECERLYPGRAVVFTSEEGYKITERLSAAQLAKTVGDIKCEITKSKRSEAKLGVRRNPQVLKEAGNDLRRAREMVLEGTLDKTQRALAAERQRAARQRAAVRVGRGKV